MNVNRVASSLLEESKKKFTPKDILSDLFPFIYTASKRMSGREISEFLEKDHGINISQPTIARALKEPEKYVDQYANKIAISTNNVREFYKLSGPSEILRSGAEFIKFLNDQEPCETFGYSDTQEAYFRKLAKDSVQDLIENWFPIDTELRQMAFEKIRAFDDERKAINAENEAKRKKIAELASK